MRKDSNWDFWAFLAVVFAFAILTAGCARQKVVTEYVNNYVHDTAYISRTHYDSIYTHDSIFMKADSVGYPIYTERWHTKYIERMKIDTCYIDKVQVRDSIITRTETITKTKNSGFAKFCIGFFAAVAVGTALLISYKIWARYAK